MECSLENNLKLLKKTSYQGPQQYCRLYFDQTAYYKKKKQLQCSALLHKCGWSMLNAVFELKLQKCFAFPFYRIKKKNWILKLVCAYQCTPSFPVRPKQH